MTTTENQRVVAAFQTWHNNGYQTSGLYLASEDGQERVDSFIQDHFECAGSFVQLHQFYDENQAWIEYTSYNE